MTAFYEEHSRLPICGQYDVIVVGGGIAGTSAALAARRLGASTLLVEKSVLLGGLATLGHVVVYLPLCDGKGRKMIGGIAEELLHLSMKYGYDNLPEAWKTGTGSADCRYRTIFNAPAFAVALDELVIAENIDLLFDTTFSRPIMQDGWCQGVIVENKSGRQVYQAKVVIDASGDADVCHRAGIPSAEADNWLSLWGYDTQLDHLAEALQSGNIIDAIKLTTFGGDASGRGAENSRKYLGTQANEVTEFVLAGRRLLRTHLARQDKRRYSLLALPGMAQFRTTRRIVGGYELTSEDVNQHFADSIGCTGDWRQAGPVYEIPYRCLIANDTPNIIAAGRIISAKGDAWEVTRVIPPAAATGQAAGTAAALAVKERCALPYVDMAALQATLAANGIRLHH